MMQTGELNEKLETAKDVIKLIDYSQQGSHVVLAKDMIFDNDGSLKQALVNYSYSDSWPA